MNRDLRQLARIYAKEKGLKLEDVLNAVNIPFEFFAHIMKDKCNRDKVYFPSVRIPYWGIYHSPEWMRKRFKKR